MTKHPLLSTTKLLSLVLLGLSPLAGCDVEDEGTSDLELAEEALDEDAIDEVSFSIDPEVLDAIAEAPELADDEVEALFASTEPTLRDVIRLVDPDNLPADLTVEDLDAPVLLGITEPPVEDAIDPLDDFSAEVEPQLIGEQACATTSISNANNGGTIAMTQAPNCGYAWDGLTSPNTSYNPSGCPNQYITHVSGTQGEPLSFYAQWHGTTLNETYCELASMALSAYGGRWVVQNVNGTWYFTIQWTKFGTTLQHGSWTASGWFQGCNWQYENGYGPLPTLASGHFYNRIRTAAQGVVLAVFPFKQRVESGVFHGAGPC